MFENRRYVVINVADVDSVNFNEIMETSVETLRHSLDGAKTFVKYESEEEPGWVASIPSKEGPYTHSEMLMILATDEWTLVDILPEEGNP